MDAGTTYFYKVVANSGAGDSPDSAVVSATPRDASCSDIQQQLATLRGGALRRSTLRRHVESCPACQAFRAVFDAAQHLALHH